MYNWYGIPENFTQTTIDRINPKHSFKYDGHTKFGTGERPGIYDVKRAKFVPGPNVYR